MEKIYNLIFSEEEVGWQSLLMQTVRQEGMDPWDLDVSKLAKGYLKTIKKMKQANLRISGKVVLASALLLKIKSKRLIGEDIAELDRLFQQTAEIEYPEEFDEVDLLAGEEYSEKEKPQLLPHTPQPRSRKVSIFDLIEALDKAMQVRKRRVVRKLPYARRKIELPDPLDISEIIVEVYSKIKDFFKAGSKNLTFTKLLPAEDKDSKVYTFIPLLHLYNERRLNLEQPEHFGEIYIELLKRGKGA